MIDRDHLKPEEERLFLHFYGRYKAFRGALMESDARERTVHLSGRYGHHIKMADGSWVHMPDFDERD